MERKKDVQEVIEWYYSSSFECNQMMLIHSNVSRFFKKQHSKHVALFCKQSLDESSNSMDKKLFLKQIEVRRFIAGLFPLTTKKSRSV